MKKTIPLKRTETDITKNITTVSTPSCLKFKIQELLFNTSISSDHQYAKKPSSKCGSCIYKDIKMKKYLPKLMCQTR